MENQLDNYEIAAIPAQANTSQNQFSKFLSTKDLADRVEKTTKWVEKWLPTKRIPGAIKIGGEWSFDRKMVEERLPPKNTNGPFLLDPVNRPKDIQILHVRKKSHGVFAP